MIGCDENVTGKRERWSDAWAEVSRRQKVKGGCRAWTAWRAHKSMASTEGKRCNDNDNDTLKEVHPTIVSGLALQA